jgi:16S rRNA (guanine(966)-N(2))-methyltransferase RsmD
MRVIAGTCRGKKLAAPPGIITRPTSDRVKEALFSILASRIDFDDIRVLDICAGTGSLGIEALSRGAGWCCFIESNASVKAIIEKNILVTNNQDCSQILNMDAVKALHLIAGRNNNFNLVFFDPPYASELYKIVLDAVDSLNILAPEAILVAECTARNSLAESYGRLKRFDRRVYGETALELFILEEK